MNNELKILSITLARGGSKGIPRKNLIDLCGNPLLHYVLDAAKKSKYIDEVWVSTEDEEIKRFSQQQGAKVSDRPKSLASDSAKCEDVLKLFANEVDFDILCFIQTTSPLVLSDDIDKGIEMVLSGKFDSVLSTTAETWVPRWQEIEDKLTPYLWSPTARPRRQQMPELLIENGSFYITTKQSLLQSGIRYSGNIGHVQLPLKRSFQIDTLEELDLISILMNYRKGETGE